ncbi:HAD-IA family hydrolase [Nitratireductor sp. XY-223]|uniref:HAD-IA family hydrolase n=1 Tax=Nitratireductor sp. XY-223 TaxID=2561926 RepID=UPI0010AB3E40|nr:HAD-IA family hydrolase [Nitratireductor sp. XY-223]
MRLLLFDCDGTLIDSAAVIHACMEKAFAEEGFSAPELAHTKSIIGLTLDFAIARLLQRKIDDTVHRLVRSYKHHSTQMRDAEDCEEPFYEGIWELLETLAAKDDILLGVVTGKSRRGLDKLLHQHGLAKTMIATRTADECPSKPNPAMVLECCNDTGMDPSRTIVVGDAIYDIEMARNAGATAVGVSWGYAEVRQLHEAGAHHIVREPADLMPIIGID